MSIRVKARNVRAAINKAREQLEREAVQETNQKIREVAHDARNAAPVVSGKLRDSMETQPLNNINSTGRISFKAPYAKYVELGTSKFPGRYYLTQAVMKVLGVLAKFK